MHSRTIKILITIAVFAGGAGMLVYSSMADADFFKHVDEVVAEPDKWQDKNLKIHGFVEAGSIEESIVGQKTKREFVLEYQGKRIRVRNEGPKPDTFRDLAETVAKGRLVKDGDDYVFEASELIAKCPSKYEGNQRTSNYGKNPTPNTAERPGAPAGQ